MKSGGNKVCYDREQETTWYSQKILRNSELLDHKITGKQVEKRVTGAKKLYFKGLSQEHCSHAKYINHYPTLNINPLNSTEQDRACSYCPFMMLSNNAWEK